MSCAFLSDRRFIRVSGTAATEFLQNLITTDVEALEPAEARPGALLTPQGKILFDFLIWRHGDGFLLETAADQQDALLRRLTMYRLRAPVELTATDDHGASIYWDEDAPQGSVRDGRFAKAGAMVYRLPGPSTEEDAASYDALRIAHGVATSGVDYALQDAFPHDVLMDVNDGVSFKKGCFVGQEVVSRMKHRGTARRRVVLVSGTGALPATGTEIVANGKPMGTLGTVQGDKGLAIIRTDRAADAMASGQEISAGGIAVSVSLPEWSGLAFPAAEPAASTED